MEATAPVRSTRHYQFGVFMVDTGSGELRKHGMRLKFQERPFQLLVALLERPGEIVSREELRRRLWPDGTFVDFDHSISSAINKLRSALNDSATHPRYIETVGRRGYRFVADVKEASTNAASVERTGLARPISVVPTRAPAPRRWRWAVLQGITIILAVSLAGYFQWIQSNSRPMVPAGRVMLAVLPFDNLTGDAGQDYFSDGLTEEMITQLGQLDPRRVGVIARTSVMHYKHSQESLEQIGRELGVQYVLEGSVRRDSGKIRIAAQLIQVQDQTHLWARQYDRELRDLLLLQGEIAHEISDEIQTALGDHKTIAPIRQQSLSPQAYEAYNLYLQGQYFWNKRTVDGFREAIDYFQQATAKDPNCARAYAGLADSYALIGGYSGRPQTEFAAKARAAALRALELDESLPEAHTALALIVQNYDLDWLTAEKEFRRAIELNPNYATAHHWYAEHLMWQGRFDDALRESELARQLDPLSLIIAADNGAILYYSRQYDRAIRQFRYVLAMEPDFPRAHLIDYAYVQKGMFAEALADVEQDRHVNGDAPWSWSILAYSYARSGRQAQAQRALNKLLQMNRRQQVDAGALASAYIGIGNKDKAMAWLQKAAAQQSNVMATLKVDPTYDPLRGDPRFQDLLRRVGLAQ